jgi:murein DD-endopeptidase MepM/ murein hydrolase activator NlpD
VRPIALTAIFGGVLFGAGNAGRISDSVADVLGAEWAPGVPVITALEADPIVGVREDDAIRLAPDAPEPVPALAEEATTEEASPRRVVAVRRGDTLMDILLSAGLPRAEAHDAVTALASVFDPRGLKPGQEITLTYAPDSGPLVGAQLAARADRDVGLSRELGGRFTAFQKDKFLAREHASAAGPIRISLFETGLQAGVPAGIMLDMIRALSFDVDFQRDIQPGDSYEVLFERYRDETGRVAKEGSMLRAALILSGKRHVIYRHVDRSGTVDYFNERGESVRKALLKTPIDGARLTSGFGTRMHPILGYSAFHKGVDFGAPSGTPIQAAGDGVIEALGWHGGYGNYIRIRHNGEYSTAYAHMSRFAAGLRDGVRVRQGQVIGYVGSTGRSTGPHLHYEILRRGAQVNPTGVQFPTGRKLEGNDLIEFQHARSRTEELRLVATPAAPRVVAQTAE